MWMNAWIVQAEIIVSFQVNPMQLDPVILDFTVWNPQHQHQLALEGMFALKAISVHK